jgi:serine protease
MMLDSTVDLSLLSSKATFSFTDDGLNQNPYTISGQSYSSVGTSTYTNFVDDFNTVSSSTVSANSAAAYDFGTLLGFRSYGGSVDDLDPLDVYEFQLEASSNLNLLLDGLSADADLWLAQDFNRNGTVESGEILSSSERMGTSLETIAFNNLTAGNYFVLVSQYSGSTNYNLSSFASPVWGIQHVQGSLWSDTFSVTNPYGYTVISGNGNVDAGYGRFDLLDLSTTSVYSVLNWNLADANQGGVIYDPGNGARLFDALSLSNGSQILFEGIDRVLFAEGWFDLTVTPNDPLFQSQWNLHMMGVDNAWRFGQGSSNILIGVQDSGLGVDNFGYIHPDLRLNYYDPNNIADDYGQSSTSHGTAVQGIIAANSNNGIGMSGINWFSDVCQIDVIPGNDPGDYDLAQATQAMINQANLNGQRLIINMSLSGGIDPAFEQLIANNQNNALFVIASGNENVGALSYPAILAQTYSNVVAVGASWGMQNWYGQATTPGDRISYPGWWGSNFGYGLSLMGPSEVIATQASSGAAGVNFSFNLNAPAINGFVPFNGTSAATPNVTGVASLVWSANPYLTASQVHMILAQTAYDLGFSGYDPVFGHGFVNADAAVRRALAVTRMSTGYGLTATSQLPLFTFNAQIANPAAALYSTDASVMNSLSSTVQLHDEAFGLNRLDADLMAVESTLTVESSELEESTELSINNMWSDESDVLIRYSSASANNIVDFSANTNSLLVNNGIFLNNA